MALSEGQVHVRDLVMGPGTPYMIQRFNPFRRRVRSTWRGKRTFGHGSWSGADFADDKTIPLRLVVSDDVTMSTWMQLDQQLAAAFAPVGETATDVELRFRYGGREYLVFGRPVGVDPRGDEIGSGWSVTECAFRADKPQILSAEELTAGPVGLPVTAGGLTVPDGGLTVPINVESVVVGGELELVNEGTTETGLLIRLDGPVPRPRITLQRADGITQTLRWHDLVLPDNRWLDIDTDARTAFLDGLPFASAHPGFTTWPMLPPGTSRLLFRADDLTEGTMTVRRRHAWW